MSQPAATAVRATPTDAPEDGSVLAGPIVLAVYAPFGTDAVLSTFPDGASHDVASHPLVRHLVAVAETGVHVEALFDRADDDTYLVSIPGGRPGELVIASQGKLDMDSERTLADFLARAARVAPGHSLVLTFEGHGAGYLPDLDPRQLTLENVTGDGRYEWRIGDGVTQPWIATANGERAPAVRTGAPVLPVGNPTMPTNHTALSTWALAEGLRLAAVPKLAVIHFDNCFNMSVELLHTVAPYAEFATGYCNYNFFSAGEAYPLVFDRVRHASSTTSGELARWFAAANHAVLLRAGHEPTVAGTVALHRMHGIVEAVDDLADALLAALTTTSGADRPALVEKIQGAIVAAQQYDSRPDDILETPDELTDLDSLAYELALLDFAPFKVREAAGALRDLLAGIKQYGDVDSPWMAPGEKWDFSSKFLAMNIFLPDPLRKGLWDWRAQYYLDVNPDPSLPPVQRHIIEFTKVTDWVDFLVEYHRDVPFVGLLPAQIPDVPVVKKPFDARFPRRPAKPLRGC